MDYSVHITPHKLFIKTAPSYFSPPEYFCRTLNQAAVQSCKVQQPPACGGCSCTRCQYIRYSHDYTLRQVTSALQTTLSTLRGCAAFCQQPMARSVGTLMLGRSQCRCDADSTWNPSRSPGFRIVGRSHSDFCRPILRTTEMRMESPSKHAEDALEEKECSKLLSTALLQPADVDHHIAARMPCWQLRFHREC